MTSICAWRFSHICMSTDIKKLRSSTILVMPLELVVSLLSSLSNTVYFNLSGQVLSIRKQEQALFTESYGCFSFIVRTSSAKEDRAMTRLNWDR
jgi:hypothetical protein